MGRLLSRDLRAEVSVLLDPLGKGPHKWQLEQARFMALEREGFRTVYDVDNAKLLIALGAVNARIPTDRDGAFWHMERADVEGYARMFLESDITIVSALMQTVKLVEMAIHAVGIDAAVQRLTEALNAFEGKLTEQDLLAIETVARLGDAQAVVRYLAEAHA